MSHSMSSYGTQTKIIDHTATDDNIVTNDTDGNEKSEAMFLPSLRSIIAAFLAGNARCS